MKRKRRLTQDAFDRLLAWLNPDRLKAGEKYEEIRQRLMKVFVKRGCPNAEELADETIDRVIAKVAEIADDYIGDPVAYFCGAAHKVFLEYVKPKPVGRPVPLPDPSEDKERSFQCLEDCMDHLDAESRELILKYYREEKRAKIDCHKEMAEQLGVTVNTLRMRAHRIKGNLGSCVRECMIQVQV